MPSPAGPGEGTTGPAGVVPPAQRIAAAAIGRLTARPPVIWLVSGPPSDHRSAVAGALARDFPRASHIEGDALSRTVVRGLVLPGDPPADESERQLELSIRNQCLLARSFAEAGFTPVIEFAVLTAHHLDAYRHYLAGAQLHLAVVPSPETPSGAPGTLLRDELWGIGHWVGDGDPGACAQAALRSGEAVIP